MKVNIKLIHDENRNCFEDAIATIATYLECDFQMAFASKWDLTYKQSNGEFVDSLADSIFTPTNMSLGLLENYHGVQITNYSFPSSAEAFDFVKNELSQQRPLLVNNDSFWNPWQVEYQKKHFDHAFLVIGIDGQGENFLCIDPVFNLENITLHKSNFLNGFKSLMVFSLKNDTESLDNWRNLIENYVVKLFDCSASCNMFQSIRNFALDIQQHSNLLIEIEGSKGGDVPEIVYALSRVRKSRNLFAAALEYIANAHSLDELADISEKLVDVSNSWGVTEHLFSKCYFTKRPEKFQSKIADRVFRIADEEENIAAKLLAFVRYESVMQSSNNDKKHINNTDTTNIRAGGNVYIDLFGYLNNNSFNNSVSDDSTADLTGMGHYFVSESIPSNTLMEIDKMIFKMPILDNGFNDNISCSGESISVPSLQYNKIFVLACAEGRNYECKIVLSFDDGYKEKIKLFISDAFIQPSDKEKIAWTGVAVNNSNVSEIRSARIYAQSVDITYENAPLKGIRLPDIPNIHIYAITLVSVLN